MLLGMPKINAKTASDPDFDSHKRSVFTRKRYLIKESLWDNSSDQDDDDSWKTALQPEDYENSSEQSFDSFGAISMDEPRIAALEANIQDSINSLNRRLEIAIADESIETFTTTDGVSLVVRENYTISLDSNDESILNSVITLESKDELLGDNELLILSESNEEITPDDVMVINCKKELAENVIKALSKLKGPEDDSTVTLADVDGVLPEVTANCVENLEEDTFPRIEECKGNVDEKKRTLLATCEKLLIQENGAAAPRSKGKLSPIIDTIELYNSLNVTPDDFENSILIPKKLFQLRRDFFRERIHNDESVPDFVNRIISLAESLEIVGICLTDDDIAWTLLLGLPTSYSYIKKMCESYKDLPLSKITRLILNEYEIQAECGIAEEIEGVKPAETIEKKTERNSSSPKPITNEQSTMTENTLEKTPSVQKFKILHNSDSEASIKKSTAELKKDLTDEIKNEVKKFTLVNFPTVLKDFAKKPVVKIPVVKKPKSTPTKSQKKSAGETVNPLKRCVSHRILNSKTFSASSGDRKSVKSVKSSAYGQKTNSGKSNVSKETKVTSVKTTNKAKATDKNVSYARGKTKSLNATKSQGKAKKDKSCEKIVAPKDTESDNDTLQCVVTEPSEETSSYYAKESTGRASPTDDSLPPPTEVSLPPPTEVSLPPPTEVSSPPPTEVSFGNESKPVQKDIYVTEKHPASTSKEFSVKNNVKKPSRIARKIGLKRVTLGKLERRLEGFCSKIPKWHQAEGWILHREASHHMAVKREFFINYKQVTNAVIACYETGTELPVVGRGDIELATHVGWMEGTVVLSNALYVPALPCNIVSMDQAMNNRCTVNFERGMMIVRDHNNEAIMKATKIPNSLYKVVGKAKKQCCSF